jgi:hypothetical protein
VQQELLRERVSHVGQGPWLLYVVSSADFVAGSGQHEHDTHSNIEIEQEW